MFNVFCDNKGCGKQQEAKLDVKTNDVYCAECGKVINSITPFFKTQMKTFGQVKRNEKKQQAFSVECEKCNSKGQPILVNEKGKNKVLCYNCKKELDKLSGPFKHSIITFLQSSKIG
jgi:DNA-directed RNA polymerase subunit RPC12/RpoP